MERQYSEEQLMTFCQAMANVAAADGRVTEDERNHLDDIVSGLGLSPRDPKVSAIIEAEFAQPGSLTAIVAKLESKELRVGLLRLLVEVSCADGEIAAGERTKVIEAASIFGFDATIASDLITWTLDSMELEDREQGLMERLLS